ncbi:MAG: hypothetical protein K2F95_00950 [Alistipes sp.]|nr:hypothetical protein [Alistipes sp.]
MKINIFRRVLSLTAGVAIIGGSLSLTSCKEDETTGYEGGAFLYLENAKMNNSMKDYVSDVSLSGFTAEAIISNDITELASYDIRSNRDWYLEVENPETDSWLKIYPADGKLDGRVKFLCEDNDNLTERQTNVYIYYADGTLAEPMLTVRQKANVEHIDLYVNGSAVTRASATTAAASFDVTIRANVPYYYKSETEWPEEWFRLTETSQNTFTLNIDRFDSESGKREGYITFYGAGEHSNITTQLRVMQSAFNADNSVVVTIEELLASLGSDGVVMENYSVEATVISDIENGNIDSKTLVVEDASQKGLCLNLTTENTFKAGTKIKVWLLEKTITPWQSVDGVVVADNIFDPIENAGLPTPIEVTSVEDATKYYNTLVTLKNAEWVFPYGTYYPGDESAIYGNTNAFADADHARLLRLGGGGAINAYVEGGNSIEGGANFKHVRFLPKGSGDISGIIMPRHTNTGFDLATKQWVEYVPVFRMRSADDDKISDAGTRTWTDIVEFVFDETFDKSGTLPITPSAGAGTLKTTYCSEWDFNSGGGLYAGYNYWRKILDQPAASPNAYIGLNGRGPWIGHEGSDQTSYGEINGEAWVCTVSTADVTANEQLAMFFATSSSATGPRYFVIEWATSETGPFTEIGRYESTNWDAQKYPPEFYFALPAECAGQQTLVVRCRLYKDQRADLSATSAIGASGTNRMCAFAIAKRAK